MSQSKALWELDFTDRELSDSDWESHCEAFKKLYFIEGRKLAEVRETMAREYNFYASEGQYEERIENWGQERGSKNNIQKGEKRKIEEDKESEFKGCLVGEGTFERFQKRFKVPVSPGHDTRSDLGTPRGGDNTQHMVIDSTPAIVASTIVGQNSSSLETLPDLVMGDPTSLPATTSVYNRTGSCSAIRAADNPGIDTSQLSGSTEREVIRLFCSPPNPTGSPDPVLDGGVVDSLGSEVSTRIQSARETIEQMTETETIFAPSTSSSMQEKTMAAVRLFGTALARQGYKNTEDWMFERRVIPHLRTCCKYFKQYIQLGSYEVNQFDMQCLARIAYALSEQGEFKDAEELGVQVLAMRKETLGEAHQDTLISMVNLAVTFEGLARWKEAGELGVQALAVMITVLGRAHLDTLHAMNRLAHIFIHQGWWVVKQEELGFEALIMTKNIVNGTDPYSSKAMVGEPPTATRSRWWIEMEELLRQVLAITKNALGEAHPETLHSMAILESTLSGQGRSKEAEDLAVQVLAMRQKVLGETHPDTLVAMANLGETFASQARWAEGEEMFAQVLDMLKDSLGEAHQYTLQARSNLAAIFSHQLRWYEAEELETEVVLLRKRVYGDVHPATLDSIERQLLYQEGIVQAASTPPQSPVPLTGNAVLGNAPSLVPTDITLSAPNQAEASTD